VLNWQGKMPRSLTVSGTYVHAFQQQKPLMQIHVVLLKGHGISIRIIRTCMFFCKLAHAAMRML
jgi:hypothetical protein